MKNKLSKKSLILLVSLVLILTATIGGTVAYLFEKANMMKITFIPAAVSCEVVETAEGYTVKNTGDTAAFVRMAVVANWVTEEGKVYGFTPITENDYKILTEEGWTLTEAGYYIFATALDRGESTTPMVFHVNGEAPEGCRFAVEILAEAIQSSPAKAAEEAWGFTAETEA